VVRVRCIDGSVLAVLPVPSLDRGGTPYEITLELHRDDVQFGAVGQRCGYLLARLVERLVAARADGSAEAARWPDPDDRFPDPALPGAARTHAVSCAGAHRAGTACEPELFALRSRDRVDRSSTGELRCTLRTSAVWLAAQEGVRMCGRWRVARRAVVEAWGSGGRGVRAVLTSAELVGFLGELVAEAERLVGPSPDTVIYSPESGLNPELWR
jgi:hypothetical protein